MTGHDDLTERLRDELSGTVEDITDGPITMDAVRDRAGRIRRRRATAVGIGATAVAIAVGIPFALSQGALPPGSSPQDPAKQISEPLDEPVLLTADAPEGDPPELPYIDGETLITPGGAETRLSWSYNAFAPVGDEFLTVRQGDPGTFLDVLDSNGEVVDTTEINDVAVSSPDGSIAAWGTPDGDVVVRHDGRTRIVGSLPQPVQPVEVVGSGSCEADDDCRIYYNEPGAENPPGVMDADGTTQELGGDLRTASAVSSREMVGGLTTDPNAAPESETCSAIVDMRTGEPNFETCSLAFFAPRSGFSPSGDLVVAEEVDPDGAGPAAVSLLDSTDGTVFAEVRVPQSEQEPVGRIIDTVWEDDEHLLVKTEASTDGAEYRYTVFRVGLDGSAERLLQSEVGGGGIQPWILPL